MLARPELILVPDLSEIDGVQKHFVDLAAGQPVTALFATRPEPVVFGS